MESQKKKMLCSMDLLICRENLLQAQKIGTEGASLTLRLYNIYIYLYWYAVHVVLQIALKDYYCKNVEKTARESRDGMEMELTEVVRSWRQASKLSELENINTLLWGGEVSRS